MANVGEGNLRIQDVMRQLFGPHWSGGSQLWWEPERGGARLTLTVDVEAAGRYTIVGAFTKAKDYGRFQVYVNGIPVGQPFDGFHPREVIHSGRVVVGEAPFQAGENELIFEIVDKHSDSTGYMLGIDYLQLLPVSPP
jgi:hypothetical protein